MRTLRYAGTGVLLGTTWAVVARGWMRLVSTDPEFSWGGTLSIVGTAALGGAGLGLVTAARRRGGSPWWRLAALPVLLLFASPGVVLLPAAVLGGWGVTRGRRGRAVAAVGVVAAPVLLLALTVTDPEADPPPYVPWAYWTVGVVGLLVLGASLAWAGSVALRPWRPAPRPVPVPAGPVTVG